MRLKWTIATFATLLFGMTNVGWADIITFDLEGLATGNYTTITDTQGGLTLSVHRADNGNLTIENLAGQPAAFGARTIGNFSNPFGSQSTMIFNFSSPIIGGSISFGDFNADDDGTVTMTAFSGLNGTGSTLGTTSVLYPESLDIGFGNSAIRTLSLAAAGIQSFTIVGGGVAPTSLYFDNVVATTSPVGTPVPEPTSVLLLGSGIVAFVAGRRRRLQRH